MLTIKNNSSTPKAKSKKRNKGKEKEAPRYPREKREKKKDYSKSAGGASEEEEEEEYLGEFIRPNQPPPPIPTPIEVEEHIYRPSTKRKQDLPPLPPPLPPRRVNWNAGPLGYVNRETRQEVKEKAKGKKRRTNGNVPSYISPTHGGDVVFQRLVGLSEKQVEQFGLHGDTLKAAEVLYFVFLKVKDKVREKRGVGNEPSEAEWNVIFARWWNAIATHPGELRAYVTVIEEGLGWNANTFN